MPTKWLAISSKEAWVRAVAPRGYHRAARAARPAQAGLNLGLIFLFGELHA
jgi:hypothetical protein